MEIALKNPVFALRIDIYARIHAEYALMDAVYALINAKYESMNGVYEGIIVVPESINDGFESINGSLEGRNGVYEGKKCVALASTRGHNPCRNNHKDEGMALYDNPGALYDSGLLYDDSSSPQLASRIRCMVEPQPVPFSTAIA